MGDVSLNSVWEKALKLNIKLGVYSQLCSESLLTDFQYKKLCQKMLSESLDFARQQSNTEQQLADAVAKGTEIEDCSLEEGEVYVK